MSLAKLIKTSISPSTALVLQSLFDVPLFFLYNDEGLKETFSLDRLNSMDQFPWSLSSSLLKVWDLSGADMSWVLNSVIIDF